MFDIEWKFSRKKKFMGNHYGNKQHFSNFILGVRARNWISLIIFNDL